MLNYQQHTLNVPFVWEEGNNNHDFETEIYDVVVSGSIEATENNEEESSFDQQIDPCEA